MTGLLKKPGVGVLGVDSYLPGVPSTLEGKGSKIQIFCGHHIWNPLSSSVELSNFHYVLRLCHRSSPSPSPPSKTLSFPSEEEGEGGLSLSLSQSVDNAITKRAPALMIAPLSYNHQTSSSSLRVPNLPSKVVFIFGACNVMQLMHKNINVTLVTLQQKDKVW